MSESVEQNQPWLKFLYGILQSAPLYHIVFEVVLCLGIIWMVFKRSYKPVEHESLTEKEKEELIAEWQPEPLVPKDWKMPENLQKAFNRHTISRMGKYVTFEHRPDRPALNVASMNYLNFIGDPELEDTAVKTLRKYGVGSCGPRGFYGTMDVHLKLEEHLAQFMKCEEGVVYSYGFSTVASAIPAYAKRTDVIFADEGVCFAIQKGLTASRSRLKFFRHNDMGHLREMLIEQEKLDVRDPKKARATRRFIVVEGLYINHGDLCPLPELVELKYRYKVRLFVDESHSFGVLGSTGRGVTEHFNVSVDDIDLISGSLETSIASCGGFCVGTKYVVDHQRLSGQGYCFSASLPPLLASAADHALAKISTGNAQDAPLRLQSISRKMQEYLKDRRTVGRYWTVSGAPESPLKHLRLKDDNTLSNLEIAVEYALEKRDVLFTVARYLWDCEHKPPVPSIRLALNCDLKEDELQRICNALVESGKFVHSESSDEDNGPVVTGDSARTVPLTNGFGHADSFSATEE